MKNPDLVRYCIGCRGQHRHFYNKHQDYYECDNCGLLALDQPTK